MKVTKSRFFPYLIILFATLFFYLPIIINPSLFLNRNNDLQEFFWPIYYFVKNQILTNHTIPLWNNLILSGTPLLPDPQAPFFYLPNILFLFLPINSAFIFSAILHTFFGGVGTYLIGKKILNLRRFTSPTIAILFVMSPKLAGYVEAGHFGLILNWAWLPWLFFSTVHLFKKPKIISSIFLAISITATYYTHPTTFIYATATSSFIFLFLLFKSKNKIKSLLLFGLAGLLSFGLSAISLLPQIAWIPETNRYLLSAKPEVWPIWNSKLEIVKQMFIPSNGDTEKWIPIGLIAGTLALMGFLNLKNNIKIWLLVLLLPILIISANNATPLYEFLLSQKWYDYLRVSTRGWFAINLAVIFLAGIGLEEIGKRFSKTKLPLLFTVLCIFELLFLSWKRYYKEAPKPEYAPIEIYEYLAKDKDKFRVYCLTRCLSQKQAAIYNLELIDGYSTLIQKNYNSHALQLTGAYWDYYTLSIPPIGAYLNEKLNPNFDSLGSYNAKYIISPYKLESRDISLNTKIDKYFIYINLKYQSRSEAPIVYFSPNLIKIDTSNYLKESLVISEVYSTGWKAYTDKGIETQILEAPNAQRSIAVPRETKYLEIKYQPPNYEIAKKITISTLIILIFLKIYIEIEKYLDKLNHSRDALITIKKRKP